MTSGGMKVLTLSDAATVILAPGMHGLLLVAQGVSALQVT